MDLNRRLGAKSRTRSRAGCFDPLGEEAMERIFNLFVYVQGETISEIGAVVHETEGSDAEKFALLQAGVDGDHEIARRWRLAPPIEWDRYEATMRLGYEARLFESAFVELGAPQRPLYVVTPIVDVAPKILAVLPPRHIYRADFKGTEL